MERIKELYEALRNKQSWIRKGLKKFMIEWKELTKDCPIEIGFYIHYKEDKYCEKESMNYYIKIGSEKIYTLEECYEVDIDNIDVEAMKNIILGLDDIYERLVNDLEGENIYYDNLAKILKKIGG